jgi:hypothetical protein
LAKTLTNFLDLLFRSDSVVVHHIVRLS